MTWVIIKILYKCTSWDITVLYPSEQAAVRQIFDQRTLLCSKQFT